METGTTACRIFILLSCGGEESLKPDGQHNTGVPVTLALTAFFQTEWPTHLRHAQTHTRAPDEAIESEIKAFLLNVKTSAPVEGSGDCRGGGPKYW